MIHDSNQALHLSSPSFLAINWWTPRIIGNHQSIRSRGWSPCCTSLKGSRRGFTRLGISVEDPAPEYSYNPVVLTSNLTLCEEYARIRNEDKFYGESVKFEAISKADWGVLYRVDSSCCLCIIYVCGSFCSKTSVGQLLLRLLIYLYKGLM